MGRLDSPLTVNATDCITVGVKPSTLVHKGVERRTEDIENVPALSLQVGIQPRGHRRVELFYFTLHHGLPINSIHWTCYYRTPN
jgi:hypothetical protein